MPVGFLAIVISPYVYIFRFLGVCPNFPAIYYQTVNANKIAIYGIKIANLAKCAIIKKRAQKGRVKTVKLHELRKITKQMQPISGPKDQQKVQDLLCSIGIDPGSFYQELEMSSRFVDTHQDMSFSNANVSLHSHNF